MITLNRWLGLNIVITILLGGSSFLLGGGPFGENAIAKSDIDLTNHQKFPDSLGSAILMNSARSTHSSPSEDSVLYPNRGACLWDHLKDALEINHARKSLYQAASEGRSKVVSDALIRMERVMLLGAPIFDAWSSYFHREGIPVLCQDLTPMSETPAYADRYPEGVPSSASFVEIDENSLVSNLTSAFRRDGFAGLDQAALPWYMLLAREPRFNCLTRHFLESVIRSSRLAQKYIEAAKGHLISSPAYLMQTYLWLNLKIFKQAVEIDRLSMPLQAQGLPIICRDVPHIPLDSDWTPE